MCKNSKTGCGCHLKDTNVVKNYGVGVKGDTGQTGATGANGLTPYIGSNGHWWIGTTDTGVVAGGSGGGSSYTFNRGINNVSGVVGLGTTGFSAYTGGNITIGDGIQPTLGLQDKNAFLSVSKNVTAASGASVGASQVGSNVNLFKAELSAFTPSGINLFTVSDKITVTSAKGIYLYADVSSSWLNDGTDDLVLVNKKWVEDKINASGGGSTPIFVSQETPSGIKNSSNKIFTLAFTPVSGSEMVFVNGLLQELTTDYTISGAVITLVVAPDSTDKIKTYYRK